MKLKIGDKAPNFILPDQDGQVRSLVDYKGKWLLIYFYPKDATPGCTVEGQVIRDSWKEFQKRKISVVGISADSVERHKKFSEKQEFPFLLLADEEQKTVKDYGVWGKKKFMGREFLGINRNSFLVGADGKIVKIYEKVKPKEHADEVLSDFAILQSQ